MEGALVWITGLAGSGKTTIAKKVVAGLKQEHAHTAHLDGDNMREILGGSYGHSPEDRLATAKIYARLAAELTKQGINVVVSTISLIHEIHDLNRENNKQYFEILLQTSEEELRRRRKLYKNGSEVMGIHQEPQYPKQPSLVLENNKEEDLKTNIQKILKLIGGNDDRQPKCK
ncbi:adenylyl-sulfate kinase [Candidatus Woesearchaeota archaeon]|nr:adenylyl-sulfate kinase [Candidatus Woesearchaeota archaeon]